MPIDIERETLISFSDARSSFKDGRRKSLATLHRWRLSGIRGTRLETVLIGGARYTSLEAIDRFLIALNAEDDAAKPVITASQRQRQSEAAQDTLGKMGVSSAVVRSTKDFVATIRVAKQ
ncbi:MAG: DUF1580 domain-containing protein [Planctomyces sp.]|nr:DUF1580 domain-containing protein [Planctomyces sp.]